jgi:hypothetical protein
MVDEIQQARQQLQTQRTQIAQRRAKSEEARRKAITPTTLRTGGRAQLLQRQKLVKQIGIQEKGLQVAEAQIKKAEVEVAKASRQTRLKIASLKAGFKSVAKFKGVSKVFKKSFEKADVKLGKIKVSTLQVLKDLEKIIPGKTKAELILKAKLAGTRVGKLLESEKQKIIGLGNVAINKLSTLGILTLPSVKEEVKDIKLETFIDVPSKNGQIFINKKDKLGQKFKRLFNIPETRLALEKLEISRGLEELIPKEKPITFIDQPSPVAGGTRIRRIPDISDVDTGALPAQQNLNIKVNDIITRFSLGTINENKLDTELKEAQKKFISDEVKRTLPADVAISLGIGVISAILPPVGIVIGGLSGVEAFRKRKDIIKFAKENPKAFATVMTANVVAGFAGAGIAGIAKGGTLKLKDPSISFKGKGKITLDKKAIKSFEPKFDELIKNKKITGTREFEIDVPNPQGKDIKLKIVEFSKDGKAQFIGQEIVDGKPIRNIRGSSISQDSGSLTRAITSSFKRNYRGKVKDVEIRTFLEKVNEKVTSKKPTKISLLTESETKLSRKFGLKKLSPEEFREVIRRELGDIKSRSKKGKPFTEKEFEKASKLSKTRILSQAEIIKVKAVKQKILLAEVDGKKIVIKKITSTIGKKKKGVKIRKETIGGNVKGKFFIKPKALIKRKRAKFFIKEKGIGISKLISKEPKKKKLFIDIGKEGKIKVIKKPTLFKKVIKPIKRRNQLIKLERKIDNVLKNKGKNILLKRRISPAGAFKELGKETQIKLLKQFKTLGIIKKSIKTLPTTTLTTTQRAILLKQRDAVKQKIKNTLKNKQILREEVISDFEMAQSSLVGLQSALKTIQKTKLIKKLITIKQIKIGTPTKPTKIKIPPIKPFIPISKQKKRKLITKFVPKGKGYNVWVKSKGKLIKANIKPIAKPKAQDLGSWLTDRTLSKQFKIKRTSRKAQTPAIKTPRNYFLTTQKKWRGKIVKGKELPIKNQIIERNKAAIDTLGEKKKLSAAREIKKLQTKAKKRIKEIRLKSTSTIKIKKLRGGKK